MEVFDIHEHPLILVDLELVYEEKQDAYEDEHGHDADNLVIEEEFRCRCNRCDGEINEHHRYYYKCSTDSCDYSIHNFFCVKELPPTLHHPSHERHILTLLQRKDGWWCDICRKYHKPLEKSYNCSQCEYNVDLDCALTEDYWVYYHPSHTHPLVLISEPILCNCHICGKKHEGIFYQCNTCDYFIHSDCALKGEYKRVYYHPSHRHPLVLISEPILCYCHMCGNKHEGIFYQCDTCVAFFIHSDCVALPRKLFIQERTDGVFSHTHPLTLSYSFPEADWHAARNPTCRVCGKFFTDLTLSFYKCGKCWFYTHLDCATSRREPFMGILTAPGN